MNRLDLIETYDMYESLLTEKEKEIFNLYYEEDLTLEEISDNLHITKSAVSKTLKVTEKKLTTFEAKLHKLELKNTLKSIIKDDNLDNIKERITKIIDLQEDS